MKLHIAMPVKDAVFGPTHKAIVETVLACERRGISVTHEITWLGASLPHVRAELLRGAVASDADRVLWVDSDIVFSTEDVVALLAIDEDLVSAVYQEKRIGGHTVGMPLEGAPQRGALLEMSGVGFGLLAASRACMARMLERYGARAFAPVELGKDLGSEDYSFCARWRELGGRIWLHSAVRVAHIGLFRFGGTS